MNEFELIEMLMREAPRVAEGLALGTGDDCAIIEGASRDILVTTDALVEGRHFTLDIIDLHTLGRRAIAVSVSDIAAMGGVPRFATIYLGVPPGFDERRCRTLYDGIHEAARDYSLALIGGDTTCNDALTISLTIIGDIEKHAALRRSGARPGDAVYITGRTGEAALGLACLKKRISRPESSVYVDRYRNPTARVTIGRALAGSGMVSAMIDISDGLIADIGHLADSSKTGYEVIVRDVPRQHNYGALARALDCNPDELMLTGGDDYELAFTVKRECKDDFNMLIAHGSLSFDVPLTLVGTMVDDPKNRRVVGEDGVEIVLHKPGYTHALGGS